MKKIHKIYFIVAYIFVIIFCMVGCNNETNHVVTTIKPTIPVSTIDTTDTEHVEATAQPDFENATKHLAQEIHKTIGDDDAPDNSIQRYLADKLFICEVYIPEGLSEYEGENQEIAFIWGEQYSIDTKFDCKTYRGNPILVEFSKDKKKIIDIKIPNKLGDMNEQMEEIFGEKVLIDLSDSYNDEMYSQKSLKVSKKISDIALSGGFQVNLTNDVYKLWLELHNNGYFSGETIENAIFKYYADNYFFNINQFAVVSWYEHFRQETDDKAKLYTYMFISHLHDNNVGQIGTSCIPTVVYLEKNNDDWQVSGIQEAQDGEAGRKDILKLFGEHAESFIKKVDYPDYCSAELEKHEEKVKKIYSGDLTYKH